MAWTDDRVETVKRMWADGYSAGLIAEELGDVTRNAVVSKVTRLGLPPRGESKSIYCRPRNYENHSAAAKAREAKRPPRVRKPNGNNPTGFSGKVRAWVVPDDLPPPIADSEIPLAQRRTLLQLTKHTCKWPIGDPQSADFYFCGGPPLKGSSYCPHHTLRSYSSAAAMSSVRAKAGA